MENMKDDGEYKTSSLNWFMWN